MPSAAWPRPARAASAPWPRGIAEALVTTAFGIGVAIIALWCYNLLNTKTEVYDAEMSNTASQVIDFFVRKQAK